METPIQRCDFTSMDRCFFIVEKCNFIGYKRILKLNIFLWQKGVCILHIVKEICARIGRE